MLVGRVLYWLFESCQVFAPRTVTVLPPSVLTSSALPAVPVTVTAPPVTV